MSDFIVPEKSKRTIQDIVFAHLERILEMCKQEFTGGYTNHVISGNLIKAEYVGDKKEEYCQLVEALAQVLLPSFDPDMTTKYNEFTKEIDEIKKKHHDVDGLSLSDKDYLIFSKKRLTLTQNLFSELNLLLGRKGYLKTQMYTVQDIRNELDQEDIVDIDEDK